MQQQQVKALTNIISKLRIFHGLNLNEAGRLLKICGSRVYQPSEVIYHAGEPSQEIYILLQGGLKAVGKAGTTLGEILPGASCGEMGVFSGRNRSATVVATQKCLGFVITKQDLKTLLSADPEMNVKVLQNMVELLSERLEDADTSIESHAVRLKQVQDEHGLTSDLDKGV